MRILGVVHFQVGTGIMLLKPAYRHNFAIVKLSGELSSERPKLRRRYAESNLRFRATGRKWILPRIMLMLASIFWVSSALPCLGQSDTGSIAGSVTDAG